MNPSDEKTIEIARRTRKNLEYVFAQYNRGEPVYEFTQLFNSMLGILVCLREEYYIGSSIEWSEVEKKGLSAKASFKKHGDNFTRLISNVRHAFAHSNYEFKAQNRTIVGVKLWNVRSNTNPNDRRKKENWTWQAEFTEDELRAFAYLMLNYLEQHFGLDVNGEPEDPPDAPQVY